RAAAGDDQRVRYPVEGVRDAGDCAGAVVDGLDKKGVVGRERARRAVVAETPVGGGIVGFVLVGERGPVEIIGLLVERYPCFGKGGRRNRVGCLGNGVGAGCAALGEGDDLLISDVSESERGSCGYCADVSKNSGGCTC